MVNDSNDEEKFYFGLADTTIKERYKNKNRDFKHGKYENSTELAKGYVQNYQTLFSLIVNISTPCYFFIITSVFHPVEL